ncbi:MAG: YkgJ family cysteine cluster protein [Deltaproteobacteria bacterium]|nr:YkgJ family cysteine cluster protein [Deltaproteobacteria bacterium]
MKEKPWYASGIQFDCVGCADCCKNHGEYQYVFVDEKDILAIIAYLGMTRAEFLGEYCIEVEDWISIRPGAEDCPFLEGHACRIYSVRPKQCETWPFWNENLEREKWEGPVRKCCPGIGRGKLHTAYEIEKIARERDEWF